MPLKSAANNCSECGAMLNKFWYMDETLSFEKVVIKIIYEDRWLKIKDNISWDSILVARWALTMEWIYDVENMERKKKL